MKRLFFDIETSPCEGFFWRPGYNLTLGPDNILKEGTIICIGYKWQGEPARVLSWSQGQNTLSMLREFSKVLLEADELIYHNGDRFDLPWVSTELLKHRLPPLPEIPTVDTLKWARRKFAFNSNRLDYIAKFLGIGAKIKTSFDLWKTVVRHPNIKVRNAALKQMMDYCSNDVDLLEKVWERLSVFNPAKTHAGVVGGREKWTCPRCGSGDVRHARTYVTTKGMTQHQMQCRAKGCKGYFSISDKTKRERDEAKLVGL